MITASPLKRLGSVEEVAGMILWLCSTASAFNTGAVFDMSGGRGAILNLQAKKPEIVQRSNYRTHFPIRTGGGRGFLDIYPPDRESVVTLFGAWLMKYIVALLSAA